MLGIGLYIYSVNTRVMDSVIFAILLHKICASLSGRSIAISVVIVTKYSTKHFE